MQKPLALFLALCLGFAGCQVFDKSETWDTVRRVRPGESTRDPDPSRAYAARLHSTLASHGVEHKVVTYQYRYTTRMREEAVGTRTAIIYRDPTTPHHPWWLKDERSHVPVWLPNGQLDRQISFYLRRRAEVVENKEFPGNRGSAKTMIGFARSAPALRPAAPPRPRIAAIAKPTPARKASAPTLRPAASAIRQATPAPVVVKVPAARQPAPVVMRAPATRKPVATSTPARPLPKPAIVRASAPVVRHLSPKLVVRKESAVARAVPKAPPASPTPAEKIVVAKPTPVATPAARLATVKPAPAPVRRNTPPAIKPVRATAAPIAVRPSVADAEPLAPITARSVAPWSAPTVLDPAAQPLETAPRDPQLEKLFRAKHGTDYNRWSAGDRRKMQQLQKAATARE